MINTYHKVLLKYRAGTINFSEVKTLPKSEISWDEGLLKKFQKGFDLHFVAEDVQEVQYRPYSRRFGYRHNDLIWSQYRTKRVFPNDEENLAIATTNVAQAGFSVLAISKLFDLGLLLGDAYPLYVYDGSQEESGDEQLLFDTQVSPRRKDGITDWVLSLFIKSYSDPNITKKDIFHYCYSVLNSPEFAERFAQDARKAGPRIPLLQDFWRYSKIGENLVQLHANYEDVLFNKTAKVVYKNVSKDLKDNSEVLKLSYGKGGDKSVILINDFISIIDIPLEAQEYVVNSRSALDWVVNQYQVSRDKSTGIISDPNLYSENSHYIVDLILKVIEVSVETTRLYKEIPPFRRLVAVPVE
jgi:predicted helicase